MDGRLHVGAHLDETHADAARGELQRGFAPRKAGTQYGYGFLGLRHA